MKILIVGSNQLGNINAYQQKHLEQIKKQFPEEEVVLTENPSEISNILPEAEVMICSHNNWKLVDLALAKNLKWIHFTSAGVTDIAKTLLEKDILLTNSSGVHPIPIAEHVFGMVLMLSRRLFKAYRFQIEEKEWMRETQVLDGTELSEKTLGIVGYGRIGAYIAKLAKGFNMKTIALKHNSEIKDENIDEITTEINSILKVSDILVNCLPLTDETKGFFNKNLFEKMKPSAIFINIGRGQTVVEKELIEALQKNTIYAAGLDVFETEPLPKESPLWKLENVIISPHYSGWTPKYTDRVVEIFCENMESYLNKEPMPNLVDKEKGY